MLVPRVANAAEITLWEDVADGDVLAIDIIEAAGVRDSEKIKFSLKNNFGENRNG